MARICRFFGIPYPSQLRQSASPKTGLVAQSIEMCKRHHPGSQDGLCRRHLGGRRLGAGFNCVIRPGFWQPLAKYLPGGPYSPGA